MSDLVLSQLQQAVSRMILVATVVEVDGDRAKVSWGDGATSDWLFVAQLGSNALKFWIPPTIGTQVVVLSPGGDTTKGIIYPGPFAGGAPAGNFAGELTGTGDVVASGISLVQHVHSGIAPGPADTGHPK